MKEKESIDRLIDIGRQEKTAILKQLEDAGHLAALPEHIKIHDLEHALPQRVRYRAALQTTSVNDFSRVSLYTEGDGKTCFIDPQKMSAKTIFNLGTAGRPGHGDHHVTLRLKQTAAFEALLKINGGQISQKALAEWIEEWRSFLTAEADGEEMPLQKAITSIRTVTIEANQKREHSTGTFNAERSDMEKIEARSRDGALPGWLIFTCSPYLGLAQRSFYLRVSLITSAEPKFALRIIQLEQHEQDMAEEFRDLLEQQLVSRQAAIEELKGSDAGHQSMQATSPGIFIGTITL